MISILSRALRVYQWPKNAVVFAALIFAQQLNVPAQGLRSVAAFAVLCMASSAVYLLNDLIDIKKDREHPSKRHRPLASGELSVSTAIRVMAGLLVASLVGAYVLRETFLMAVLAYLALNVAYTFVLKHIMLVDVLSISIGFVIRAVAGALVLDVAFSNWLVVCTLFLALFLALGKRRREIELLDSEAANHRRVLDFYTIEYCESLMIVLAGTTLITYAIYTCSPEVVDRVATDKLYVTLPFVVYGLFRYIYLVHHMERGGDPSRVLIKDLPTLATVLLWAVTSTAIIYWR